MDSSWLVVNRLGWYKWFILQWFTYCKGARGRAFSSGFILDYSGFVGHMYDSRHTEESAFLHLFQSEAIQ
jgi:hypothetical protein